jgi:hypothetical protein
LCEFVYAFLTLVCTKTSLQHDIASKTANISHGIFPVIIAQLHPFPHKHISIIQYLH